MVNQNESSILLKTLIIKKIIIMYDDLWKPYVSIDLPSLKLGGIVLNGQLISETPIHLVLKAFNRHGLIAGATGTGKTKTMQVLAEQLSLNGVPSLVMDIKGDISGLAMPGETSNKLMERGQQLHIDFTPRGFPVELLTLTPEDPGVPLRARIDDFGSLLFSLMLDLNDTQAGVVTVLFEYAKANQLNLVNLDDFKSLLQFAQTDRGNELIAAQYGGIASTSIGTIVRKIIELESQGGKQFFGEPSFVIEDLLRTDANGHGVISILRLLNMQDKPKLFSSFMLKLLSDVYRQMPELGDPDKPRLVLFIDEAHLIFNYSSKALLNLIETIVKLIRSKGIGLIFCTQTPNDIPEVVLSQLGLKIQHSLRAFTAKDRKALKLVSQNFPVSNYYNTEQLLTTLSIGEALVSALDAKGQPTPLVHAMIRAPESRMGPLSNDELKVLLNQSSLFAKYSQMIDVPSAKEKLAELISDQQFPKQQTSQKENDSSVLNNLSKNTLFRQVVRQVFRELTRAILSLFKIKRN
ncbi:TPA: DUF853 family protein [Legionella pneumophila]|nr:DUF853 family protein [Legionella pneumophila]HAU1319734.1 DUF853 family protein [Legionella pneumophila]